MRNFILLILVTTIFKPCFSQDTIKTFYSDFSQETIKAFFSDLEFNSVFSDFKTGKFSGTVNGVLFIEKPDSTQIILDFQGSNCELNIIEDEHAVYDVSTKDYIGQTTSGKTKLIYTTYGASNFIEIQFANSAYNFGTNDGCACILIKGLSFYYQSEKEYEYLVLSFENDIKLRRRGKNLNTKDFIKILPKSSIIFIIRRN